MTQKIDICFQTGLKSKEKWRGGEEHVSRRSVYHAAADPAGAAGALRRRVVLRVGGIPAGKEKGRQALRAQGGMIRVFG